MEVPHNAELVGFIEKTGVGSAKTHVKVLKSIEMYLKKVLKVLGIILKVLNPGFRDSVWPFG